MGDEDALDPGADDEMDEDALLIRIGNKPDEDALDPEDVPFTEVVGTADENEDEEPTTNPGNDEGSNEKLLFEARAIVEDAMLVVKELAIMDILIADGALVEFVSVGGGELTIDAINVGGEEVTIGAINVDDGEVLIDTINVDELEMLDEEELLMNATAAEEMVEMLAETVGKGAIVL